MEEEIPTPDDVEAQINVAQQVAIVALKQFLIDEIKKAEMIPLYTTSHIKIATQSFAQIQEMFKKRGWDVQISSYVEGGTAYKLARYTAKRK